MSKKKYLNPSMEVMYVGAVTVLASSVGVTNSTTELDAILSRESDAWDAFFDNISRNSLNN